MNILNYLHLKFKGPRVASDMRRDWDSRARENARHFVATSKTAWNDEDFFESGRIWAGFHIIPYLSSICPDRAPSDMRILEIGCGVGRMTLALSELFGSVHAVDISAEMITRARETLGNRQNIHFHVNNGLDLNLFPDAYFDFVFSAIVFQHIPSKVVVANYIKEAYRVLRYGCVFKFQVQGCPIPAEDLNTWVGVGFGEEEMSSLARASGFKLESSAGVGTQEYWLTLRKQ